MDESGFQLELPRHRLKVPDVLRGLSALFWGLPAALVASIHVSLDSNAMGSRFILPMGAFALLAFGSHQLRWVSVTGVTGWGNRVDLLRILSLGQLFLSPFLFFYARAADQWLFIGSLYVLGLNWVVFLMVLCNLIGGIVQTSPDPTLHQDYLWMKGFIGGALTLLALGWTLLFIRIFLPELGVEIPVLYLIYPQFLGTFLIISAIFPVTVLMNVLWKVKEYVFLMVVLNPSECPPPLPEKSHDPDE